MQATTLTMKTVTSLSPAPVSAQRAGPRNEPTTPTAQPSRASVRGLQRASV